MARYIDAEELDNQVKNKKPPYDMNSKAKEGFKTALLSVRSMIHSANNIDVQGKIKMSDEFERLSKMAKEEFGVTIESKPPAGGSFDSLFDVKDKEKSFDEMDLAALICFRNKYLGKEDDTENSIVADAINNVLTALIKLKKE